MKKEKAHTLINRKNYKSLLRYFKRVKRLNKDLPVGIILTKKEFDKIKKIAKSNLLSNGQ